MICDKCQCDNSEDNPIFEVIDDDGFVEEHICMMCYVEELEDERG